MWYVYALELAFGLVFAADTALFCYITFRIKNQNLRALWLLTIWAHMFAAVTISMWIADKFNVMDHRTRGIFMFIWLIPMVITEIWCMVRYWQRTGKW